MTHKGDVFVEGELDGATREPTHHTVPAVQQEGITAAAVRRRRPRKVVVYYFDSEDEEENIEAVTRREVSREELQTADRRGGKPRPLSSAETSRNEEKLDCPDLAELEVFSGRHNSNMQARGPQGAVAHCSHCCSHAQPPVSTANPRIGSPTPIGFFAFGMTTLIYNVHNAKICPLNMATMGLVVMFGGLTQFLCGFFELINMNTLGCTISTTYGAFWMATAVLFLWPENAYVTMGDHTYTGGFFLLWFFFAGTLFASAFRSPFMCMALFFLVPLNFLLQAIGYFADSNVVAKVAGYEGIVVGSLATYLGMAFTLRDVYGRSLLPILFQENLRYVEW